MCVCVYVCCDVICVAKERKLFWGGFFGFFRFCVGRFVGLLSSEVKVHVLCLTIGEPAKN